MLGRIQTEPVDALCQPELPDILHFAPNLRIVKIEIRHSLPESAHVMAAQQGVPGISAAGGTRPADRAGLILGPDIKVPEFTVFILGGFYKPWMFLGRVIDNEIHDNFDSPFMSLLHQLLHILQCPIIRVNAAVVGDIIAVIAGGRVNRHQPDSADTQILRSRRITVI
ncbi:hypothetical protein D3C75_715980 [compost metagenome]